MALRTGLDLVAITSLGVYSETYVSATGAENIANLYASRGYLEDAPVSGGAPSLIRRALNAFWEFF